jgi:hypothetical protein
MQISKKIYTTLIIAILTLSTIAAVLPVALAVPINNPVLSSPNGNVGDAITVSGDGATPFGPVTIYWDDLSTEIASTYATAAGTFSLGPGPGSVVIPEDVVGAHSIIAMDDLSSTIGSATFSILSEVTLSAYSALPGDTIDVTGTGYGVGFGVGLPVGIYLGPITPVVGDSITLTGVPDSGTLTNSPAVLGTIDLDVDVTVDGDVGGDDIDPDVVVTNIAVTDDGKGVLSGTANVAVQNTGGTLTGAVDVTITGTINYITGAITLVASGADDGTGDPVTNIDVTIDACDANYSYATYDVTPMGGATTSLLGSIDETITVPAIPEVSYGAYLVTVVDLAGNTDNPPSALDVDYYILSTPTSGPAGITATLTGRIPASTAYEIRLDTTTIATGVSGADTTFTETNVISSFLSLTAHTFTVIWDVTESRDTTFTVTNSPQVTFTPTTGYVGDVITISSLTGYPFSSGADIFLYIDGAVANSTPLDDRFGPTVGQFGPGVPGSFTDLEFSIPTLAPGVYTLEVTDEFGASTGAIYTLTVQATPTATATLLGTEYYRGDTLSFSFVSTDGVTTNPTVTIRDPSGSTWWTATWAPVGPVVYTVRYQDQLFGGLPATLPNDAPLGSWNWTITWATGVLGAASSTGLFTVSAMPTTAGVEASLDDLEDTIMDALDDLDGEITDLSGDVATIQTDVGQIETTVSALDISALTSDLAVIQSDLGTLVMDVTALDAKVSAIEGDVATVDTALGTLQGTVTSIEGNTATIETDVGTLEADLGALQTDVTDIQGKVDSTPAWIAVVLSLVAAIAAIFAVITIRQKIAG